MPPDLPKHESTRSTHQSRLPHPDSDPIAVSVGILTYKRPQLLARTLDSLVDGGLLDAVSPSSVDRRGACWHLKEVLVVDNDPAASARDAVADYATSHNTFTALHYVHEPEPGLAAARNRALDEALGDVLVFIDDDEEADPGWPAGLVELMAETGAALVGAPVRTTFVNDPPAWVTAGGYFEREEPPHATTVPWLRSGNLAIDLAAVRAAEVRFDPAFSRSGGEDVAFSRLAATRGLDLRWARGEAVTETVGPDRTTVRWVTNRWRKGSSAYVRAHLASDDSRRIRIETAARGAGRLAQGLAMALAGLVTIQWGRVIKGVAEMHRGFGYLEGLAGRRGSTYGSDGGK